MNKEIKKAYNVVLKQISTAEKSQNANGKAKIKFRATMKLRRNNVERTVERTVVAQGKSADLIINNMRKGNTHKLRVLFERSPANDDGTKGGEYLTVVDLTKTKAQKAA